MSVHFLLLMNSLCTALEFKWFGLIVREFLSIVQLYQTASWVLSSANCSTLSQFPWKPILNRLIFHYSLQIEWEAGRSGNGFPPSSNARETHQHYDFHAVNVKVWGGKKLNKMKPDFIERSIAIQTEQHIIWMKVKN